MSKQKLIFHIDMNAFFCQCAIIKEPFLKDVPFVITSDTNLDKGIVLTSNYQARESGIYSAMTIIEAKRKNKFLRIVPSDYNYYKEKSDQFFNYLKRYTKIILPASIDEAYLDLTNHHMANKPLLLANIIQSSLNKLYSLPCSIGIAHTIFLAKMGSDFKKPLGITDLRSNLKILLDKDISSIYGIGRKTSDLFKNNNILLIKDFLNPINKETITKIISPAHYKEIINKLNGKSSDNLELLIERDIKSISREYSFKEIEYREEIIQQQVNKLLDEIKEELVNNHIISSVVFVKYKNKSFKSFTKQSTIAPTDDFKDIKTNIYKLLDLINFEDGIRLIGVGVKNFRQNKIIDLFSKELYE